MLQELIEAHGFAGRIEDLTALNAVHEFHHLVQRRELLRRQIRQNQGAMGAVPPIVRGLGIADDQNRSTVLEGPN
ncbi:hypothetical protein ACJGJ0_23140 (plasmid) [Xanthomonas citri pv. mangiferaeindicae]|uniref:hypothetical protein n=1 Tax=Xanthomonas TaxID=338 RepID=UPI0009CC5BFF|nr:MULTISPECIES: hypothetical protein [Xanthomonas]MBV6778827.1 hypothetical protein [Xanthomonas campestris pv. carissae]OOW50487.1 hypothetical protein Xcnt_14990 [Xanthomonas campestris pv. centellae]